MQFGLGSHLAVPLTRTVPVCPCPHVTGKPPSEEGSAASPEQDAAAKPSPPSTASLLRSAVAARAARFYTAAYGASPEAGETEGVVKVRCERTAPHVA
jgi:hypothetical protein